MLIREVFRFGRGRYSPGATLGPRDTVGYEFVRILKGQVDWAYQGSHHVLEPGTIILSQPGHREHFKWDPNEVTQHDYVHFHLNPLPAMFPAPSTWTCAQQVEAHDILHSQFQYIIDLKHSSHLMMVELIKQVLQQMLYAWVLNLHRFEDRGFADYPLPVQRVFDMLLHNWHRQQYRPPSLDDMVACSKVSRSKFIRMFKGLCQQSPTRFCEQLRLQLGHLHLLQTDRQVEEIAYHLQYPNPFQFSRSFKLRFGASPRHYRQAGLHTSPTESGYVFQRVFDKLSQTQVI